MGELVLNVVMFLASCALFVESKRFPQVGAEQYVGLGAGFWPGIILSLIIVGTGFAVTESVMRVIKSTRKAGCDKSHACQTSACAGENSVVSKATQQALSFGQKWLQNWLQRLEGKRQIIGAGILLAYTYLIPVVGFFLTTPVFLGSLMVLTGEKRRLVYILVPLGVTAVMCMFFAQVLMVILPRGVGVFFNMSRLIY